MTPSRGRGPHAPSVPSPLMHGRSTQDRTRFSVAGGPDQPLGAARVIAEGNVQMNRTNKSRALKVLAVGVVAAMAAGACGSDESSSDTSTRAGSSGTNGTATTAGPGTSTDASGDPIVIGQLVSRTGFGASTFADGAKATEAWQAWVNGNGGISGHPVRVEVVDDQSSGAIALAATESLVTTKNVIALVGAFDPIAEASSLPYLESNSIALINSFPVLPQDFSSQVVFPIGQNTVDDVASSLAVMKVAGHDDVALVACAETPACAGLGAVLEAEAPRAGIGFGGTLTVSATATDYTAQCLKLRQDDVAVLWMATAATVTEAFQADCSRQDYKPTYFFGYNAFTPSLLSISGMTALGANYTVPFFSDVPALADFHHAMAAAGYGSAESVGSLDTWAALEMFRTAMENYLPSIGGRVPTSEDVFAALYTIKDEDLGGILPQPVSYSESDHHPSMTCQFEVGIESGEYSVADGRASVCLPS
jgi:branched-chain amino acid transport system substrate-binding protein